MRKLLLFFVFVGLAIPLSAQEQIPATILTDANVTKEMQRLFKRSDAAKKLVANARINEQLQLGLKADFSPARKKNSQNSFSLSSGGLAVKTPRSAPEATENTPNGNAEHAWQFLVFLADRDRPLKETLDQLRLRIKQGTLVQASLLVTPRVFSKDNIKVEQMYFLYNDGEKPVTEHFRADNLNNTQELLSALASHLEQDNANLYTGMIVDAHGNGEEMVYKQHQQKDHFSVVDILKPFHEKNVKLDLLVLDSCEMSSFFTLYYLTQTKMVDYLAASSDIMYVTGRAMYYHVLRFLDFQPRDAAMRSVRLRPRYIHFTPDYHTTNAGVLELKTLREPLQNWANEYYALSEKMPEVKNVFKRWFTKKETLRSLSYTVARQKKYVEDNFAKLGEWKSFSDCHNEDIKNAFLQASDNLLRALRESTLTQWCYSPRADRLFWDKIPNNDCMESVSVNQVQLDRVLAENEHSFSDYQRKYICRFRF